METNFKESIKMISSMGGVNSHGRMDKYMKEISKMTFVMVKDTISILKEKSENISGRKDI
jgi:hypothetical protein